MYYIKKEHAKAFEILEKVRCIKRSQLAKLNVFEINNHLTIDDKLDYFEKLATFSNDYKFTIIDTTDNDKIYLHFLQKDVNYKMLKAIDIMLSTPNIFWYIKSDYPFTLTFATKTLIDDKEIIKTFDVIILSQGEEVIISKIIQSFPTERLIMYLDNNNLDLYSLIIKPINKTVKVQYTTQLGDKFIYSPTIEGLKSKIEEDKQ